MNRRGFLSTCIAVCVAPAIVRADSLMKVIPRATEILSVNGFPIEFDTVAGFGNRIYLLNSAKMLFGDLLDSEAWDVGGAENVREALNHKTIGYEADFSPEMKRHFKEIGVEAKRREHWGDDWP